MGLRLLAAAVGAWAVLAGGAEAGAREEALSVVERWRAAFAASDVDGIVRLYAPDALFMGTSSRAVVADAAGIRSYFQAALSDRRRGAMLDPPSVSVLSEEAVVVTGLDTLTGVVDGKAVTSRGRVTFVVARRGGEWLIVHFHRSAAPG